MVESPCVRNCCLDKKDICLGCGRSIDEIINWAGASESEKKQILKKAKDRQTARDKPGSW